MLFNYINKLLDLKDVKVKKIIQADHFIEIHIETEPTLHTCPACGNKTKRNLQTGTWVLLYALKMIL